MVEMASLTGICRREFEDVLPWLVSIYMRGRLVPFLGAGMSAPRLALWDDFVWKLEEQTPHVCHPDASDAKKLLEVRAQRACATIQNAYGRKCFLDTIRCALKGKSEDMPAQTTSLAAIRWPLAVSTNYDDLYYGACRTGQTPQRGVDVQVIGRSPRDCKLVLCALHGPFERQYVWHVQGFLGGQFDGEIQGSVDHLEDLQEQLVVGHAEYRRATNAQPHFRRCFGEMFSSCSFLFLGSDLSEDYFLNLFGEALELRGPSAVPHFALARKGDMDTHFLADQMNITVCEFDDYSELPGWLTRLRTEIESPQIRSTKWSFAIRDEPPSVSGLEITVGNPCLRPGPDEVIALIAPREQALDGSVLKDMHMASDLEPATLQEIGNHVVKYAANLYAVTALCTGNEYDDAVAEATGELLNEIDGQSNGGPKGRQSVHLQWSSSGGTVPREFGFMELIRAFGQWRRDHPKSNLRAIVHIDSDLALNLTAGRIDVHELLSSEFVRFWAVVSPGGRQEPTRRILHYRTQAKLCEVLEELGVPYENGVAEWSVSVFPSPRRDPANKEDMKTAVLRDRTLLSIGVIFGSTLVVECGGTQGCFKVAAAAS
jgi:hypothetical protein